MRINKAGSVNKEVHTEGLILAKSGAGNEIQVSIIKEAGNTGRQDRN